MRAITVVICAVGILTVGCAQETGFSPTSPSIAAAVDSSQTGRPAAVLGSRSDQACWGEATQALARLGEMGYHASQQPTPRLGLRNVARLLYDLGVLPDDSLQALGAFLSSALGMSIDSCL